MGRLIVIGIGYKPLCDSAKDALKRAGSLLASKRIAGVFADYPESKTFNDKVIVINNVDETMKHIRIHLEEKETDVVLLASGDPLYFGIGRRAIVEFGKETVEIIPDISSIQAAFALIKEPWDGAFLLSLHGGPDPNKRRKLKHELVDMPALVEHHALVCALTDAVNNPARIAQELMKSRIGDNNIVMYVCERLGSVEERLVEARPSEIAKMSFNEPNVVIIKRTCEQVPRTIFGLKETEFAHTKGLITKDEVRAVALHKLRLPDLGVMWDIGGGSGSVSIESARLSKGLEVYCLERHPDRIKQIKENVVRFGLGNVHVIEGSAPSAFAGLPRPDRIFIGGSGGNLRDIVEYLEEQKWRGVAVINSATIETLYSAIEAFESKGFEVEFTQVSVSRSARVGGMRRLEALNPVFIINAERL